MHLNFAHKNVYRCAEYVDDSLQKHLPTYNISHLSIPTYYISRGITRIFSLPKGYKGKYDPYFPPSGYYFDQSEPLFWGTRENMIHISLPLAITLTNQSHCFGSHKQSHSIIPTTGIMCALAQCHC